VPIYLSGTENCDLGGSCFNVYYDGTSGEGKISIVQPDGQTQVFDANSGYLEDYSTYLADTPILGQLDCNCADLVRWGFWGFTASNVANSTGEGTLADVSVDSLWITGNLTTRAQLENLAAQSEGNISAVYSGDAVGIVSNSDVDGSYVATGDLVMGWNFGARDGTATINGFDADHFDGGRTFDYNIYSVDDMTGFTGNLVHEDDAPSYMEGGIQGAFVNNGTDHGAGVMGNWGFDEYNWDNDTNIPDYTVGGVFMGEHVTPN
jgi:hypothetical protein